MKVVVVKDVSDIKLQKCIDGLRDVLNEICSCSDDKQSESERLFISQCLDDFIVEYMRQTTMKSKT